MRRIIHRNINNSYRLFSAHNSTSLIQHIGLNQARKAPVFSLKMGYLQQNRYFSSKLNYEIEPLPVIESLMKKFAYGAGIKPLRKTVVVYIHHPLKTSINVVDAMIRLGANPGNIFILGKSYSECPEVVKEMINIGVSYQLCSPQKGIGKFSTAFSYDVLRLWSKIAGNIGDDIEEILIMDHGGHALTLVPPDLLLKYKIVGIEKTTAGLIHFKEDGEPPFPVVNVAGCSAKRSLESPLIAEAVVDKLIPLLPQRSLKMVPGVVGYGAIGKAIAQKLSSMGHNKILVYDHDPEKLKLGNIDENLIVTNELSALLAASDYIFGCTGRDITGAKEFFRLAPSNKILISCSSEDKEFLTLLNTIRILSNKHPPNPLDNILYSTDMGATITVIRGGFPVNFDHTGESVPRNDIQLTRALILSAVFQAINIFKDQKYLNLKQVIPLESAKQAFVVKNWLKYQPKNRISQTVLDDFERLLKDEMITELRLLGKGNNHMFCKKNNNYIPKLQDVATIPKMQLT